MGNKTAVMQTGEYQVYTVILLVNVGVCIAAPVTS